MKLNVDIKKTFCRFDLALDFSVEGSRIGIFGPSGSGKSTLGSLLAGLLHPEEGAIHLNGRCFFDAKKRINLGPEKRRVAVVFQQAHLFPHLNVQRNLLYGWSRLSNEQRILDFDDVATALNIAHLLQRQVSCLSGGEKQRVALGRALLASPELLILDEPLSALDRGLKEQIVPYLRKVLRRFKIPYLYISHSLNEMRLLTDSILQVSAGRLERITDADCLARERLGSNNHGYMNHLRLTEPREVGSMLGYQWGKNELLLTDNGLSGDGLFELSSKEVLLFKKHPQALSARNLLTAEVRELVPRGGFVGVVMTCNGEELTGQVVREAAAELDLKKGTQVYAAIKATAFRRLV